ncbi:unnamed protein product [Urochloa humidicola]
MGTFLAPLPSPEHIFASTNDPEFCSILAALLAMTDDDDVGARESPRVVDESFAPTAYSTALPSFFFDDQHDPQAATPFPASVSLLGSLPPHVPVDAAHHELKARSAPRDLPRTRGSVGGRRRAHREDLATPERRPAGGGCGYGSGAPSGGTDWTPHRARTLSSGHGWRIDFQYRSGTPH